MKQTVTNLQNAAKNLNDLALKNVSESALVSAFNDLRVKFTEVKNQL